MATKKFLDKFPAGCLHGPSKHDLIRILSDLEFGPTTEKGCTIDASSIINAVQDADESPRDEDAEMDRWRMMFEGMEFWHDVTDWKPLNWELAVQAESFRLNCSRRWVCTFAKNMGCKVMTTKWVDTNKGGTSRPKYRSSLVGHEVKYDETRSLFRHSTIGDAEVIVFHVCKRSDKGPSRIALPSSTSNVLLSTRLLEDRSSSKFPNGTWNLETKVAWTSCS